MQTFFNSLIRLSNTLNGKLIIHFWSEVLLTTLLDLHLMKDALLESSLLVELISPLFLVPQDLQVHVVIDLLQCVVFQVYHFRVPFLPAVGLEFLPLSIQ